MAMFHSGKVRFGDAHPLYDGMRALKIPAALYYEKGKSLTDDGAYVMYKWNPEDGVQPKQCRSGFYTFSDKDCAEIQQRKNLAIKSAYDRNERRSKDEAMYAYESLDKGMRFAFAVECDDDNLAKSVKDALIGRRHAGHSRTAQYGLIDIQEADFIEIESKATYEGDSATVYADGRLIFTDSYGYQTFHPSAQDLGFGAGAEIDWKRSQIRTFQYAPWNAKRQVQDTDRCGIEKGSVFVIKRNGSTSPSCSAYVGCYKNEGFGKVIYNPEFLRADDEGRSTLTFSETTPNNRTTYVPENYASLFNSRLMQRLNSMNEHNFNIYEIVNAFVSANAKYFRQDNEQFASQWGYIRNLADSAKDFETFKKKLEEYLSHGVASEKWKYKKQYLDRFIDEKLNDTNTYWREIMTNLSAEMAKKCK